MYPLFLSDFNECWIFSTDFQKITYQILSKSFQLLHADSQTDMSKLIVAFRDFANASKKGKAVVLLTLTGP
jgi:hypothetical protein